MKILSRNPSERYQSMEELLRDNYFGSGNSDDRTKPADNESETGLAGFTIPITIGVSDSNDVCISKFRISSRLISIDFIQSTACDKVNERTAPTRSHNITRGSNLLITTYSHCYLRETNLSSRRWPISKSEGLLAYNQSPFSCHMQLTLTL
jgi:hypothetical protein